MKGKFLLILILISNFFFAQEISSNIIKYYEFNFCNSPQTLILIKEKNNKYLGYIKTSLKKKRKRDYKEIVKKSKITPEQAKRIISILEDKGIDLVDSTYDDDLVTYLDGGFFTIKLLKDNKVQSFSFDEIYPESKKKIETTPLRGKIQSWLSFIDHELMLKEQFSSVKKKLNKGTYCYDSGTDTVCFNKN
ncbi:RNA polymerase sigma factor region1.1 domain-containing protein [Chryseobacterium sp. PMSZPI]|uniref:RNA polymerase sigma factor region1.1 domain-containing protein n=1 Tax=Chryseobacterium sp. PMSZPI TaxID=1033900 RepID=UPI000C31FD29|nr:RNA polymerase sigma factor region1.1 domain-containing protein [Chryseobacterium sp. PMSZPI]PKF72288.1 hypothetical protein CW752_16495 [Chryseobacterium sp. PMSZPI]